MKHRQTFLLAYFILCITFCPTFLFGQNITSISPMQWSELDEKVHQLMKDGDIPGVALVLVRGSDTTAIKTFGYADLDDKTPVTDTTLFELASCSKSFTALAITHLQQAGKISMDAPISAYLPNFHGIYEGKAYDISLRQALHHTSGIPWESIASIEPDQSSDALATTVNALIGVELKHPPGQHFEYATINYDILGRVIELQSGMSFEKYMHQYFFKPLGMQYSSVGKPKQGLPIASGHKVSFSTPLEYQAPIYRGNFPAGYVLSNAIDMAQWLQIQLNLNEIPNTLLDDIAPQTHLPDTSKLINADSSVAYAGGWEVYSGKAAKITHSGWNPAFTAYVGLAHTDSLGVVVMANSSSFYTDAIGLYALEWLSNGALKNDEYYWADDNNDRLFSILSIVFGLCLFIIIGLTTRRVVQIIRKKRPRRPLKKRDFWKLLSIIILLASIGLAIFFLPVVLSGVPWSFAVIWSPMSFFLATLLLWSALLITFLWYILGLRFAKNQSL